LVENNREWYETSEQNLARGLDLFAKANLIHATPELIIKYIEETKNTKFVSDPNHDNACYELFARCIANLVVLDMRINQNINYHKAISLYRRAAMTLYMVPTEDEALIALAQRWTQKANQLTTSMSRSAMAHAFHEKYGQIHSSNQEEREFLTRTFALLSDATSNEANKESPDTRMQNLYKTSLLEHHGKYDNLLDLLSLAVMPPKPAISLTKQGLSANKIGEARQEKEFARAAFGML
jgi:hypothetical protein